MGESNINQQYKKFPIIVFMNGEYKAGFEYYLSNYYANDMSSMEIHNDFQDAKYQIDLWCGDLGYPVLQCNLFDINRDVHLV